jgi:hypothetical protein
LFERHGDFAAVVLVGGCLHNRDLLLLFVKRMNKLDPEVVFPRESTQTLARPLANFGGVATDEARPSITSPFTTE